LMAEATGLQTKVTNRATSSDVSKRLSNEFDSLNFKSQISIAPWKAQREGLAYKAETLFRNSVGEL